MDDHLLPFVPSKENPNGAGKSKCAWERKYPGRLWAMEGAGSLASAGGAAILYICACNRHQYWTVISSILQKTIPRPDSRPEHIASLTHF